MIEIAMLRIASYNIVDDIPNETHQLNGGLALVDSYQIKAPARRIKQTAQPFVDGVKVSDGGYNNVQETIQLVINDMQGAGEDLYHEIEQALEQAIRYRNTEMGNRIFIELQITAGGDIWRSEILTGQLLPEGGALVWQITGANVVECRLIFTRAYFWERLGLETVLLSNPAQSNVSPIQLYNHAASPQWNNADYGANAIQGTIATPAILRVENAHNDPTGIQDNMLAIGTFGGGVGFNHVLQAETTFQNFKGTPQVDASSSGGNFMRFTWTETTETLLAGYTIDTTAQGGGDFYKLIARINAITAPDSTYPAILIRARLTIAGLTPIYYSPWVSVESAGMLELGTIPLPPSLVGAIVPAEDLVVQLEAYNYGTGSKVLDIDFIHLFPTYDFRFYALVSFPTDYQEALIDDPATGHVYTVGGAGARPNITPIGRPLRLTPGYAGRIYWLCSESTGDTGIDKTVQLTVQYRPRRVTL